MNVAVTGGSGFVGRELVSTLIEKGYRVRILTRRPDSIRHFNYKAEAFEGDLTGSASLLESFLTNCDIVYHCAAELQDEARMHEVNVIGTKNLIEAGRGQIKHWIQLSSTGVYGNPPRGVINEFSKENPGNRYEESKLWADDLVTEHGKKKVFTYTIVRPTNVFGADMRNQSLYQLIDAVRKGIFFFIGKKGSSANYIHVRNVVNAMIQCTETEKAVNKMFILTDWTTIESFIQIIADSLKVKVPQLRIPASVLKPISHISRVLPSFPLTPGRIDALTSRCTYSMGYIQKELGISNTISIEDGLVELVNAYKRRNNI